MIRENHSSYPVTAQTHPGMTGKNNEDRFGVSAFRLSKQDDTPVLLAVLCDGIGGHQAGEVAADLAVNHISNAVAQSDGSDPLSALQTGIHRASQAIYNEAREDSDKQGMGSTAACVLVIGNQLYTATVGDSRIYLIHGSHIRQVSTDHTWIQEALEGGLLSPEQVEGHPNRHVIRRYLGALNPPVVDFRLRLNNSERDERALQNQGCELKSGERLLLCSDGLSDLVNEAEIQAAFDGKSDEEAVQILINLANQRGGHDNITIVTFSIPQKKETAVRRKRSSIPYGCSIGAIVLGMMLLVVLGYFLWKGFPWLQSEITPTPPIQMTINPLITSAPPAASTDLPVLASVTPQPTSSATPEELFPDPSTTPDAYPEPQTQGNGADTALGYP
ncbi:MAG: hypothetical protein CVU39_01365 [Chloroflexi bacterium HGW-Chloroflexi-10]|nr:MAG: hypothetical protein CVU39_01365 [Chloroflexi bacterium HGW-Chloroflexi-10]